MEKENALRMSEGIGKSATIVDSSYPIPEREDIEQLFSIETKDQRVAPFLFNDVQVKYDRERTRRDIILKARQMGFSSLICAYWLLDCLRLPNTRAVMISHEKEATKRLLNKVRFFINTMELKPIMKYQSRQEMFFPKTNSWFYIGTAGSRAFGRGDTITRLHISELAFWVDPTLLIGLLQSVPETGKIVIETTANGIGNDFYKIWMKAKNGESRFKPHFYPWSMFEEYSMRGGELIEPTSDESALAKQYNLTNDQLLWRRETLKDFTDTKGLRREEYFRQEYPLSELEAFISTGDPAFNATSIAAYTAVDPARGNFIEKSGKIEFEPNANGWWRIWDHPRSGQTFSLGADPAEGLVHRDFSAIEVVRNTDLKQVAELMVARLDPDVMGEEIVRAARYYQSAFVGIERNGPGLAVINRVKQTYSNLYHEQVYDEQNMRDTEKIGWVTTRKTKPLMITDMAAMIRDHEVKLVSEPLLTQCLSYVRNDRREFGAQAGTHDDGVMAMAIALQMYKRKPMAARFRRPSRVMKTVGSHLSRIGRRLSE